MNELRFTFAAVLLIFVGCQAERDSAPAESGEAAEAQAAPTGAVSGMAAFDYGEPYFPQPIQMSADPNCVRMHDTPPHTEFVLAGEGGGLQNVFVYVKSGIDFPVPPPPEQPVVLDQTGCLYVPHVFGVRVGQPLSIVNSDDTLHNIHAMPVKNKEFNVGQPIQGLKTERVFDQAEVMVPFKCDVHKWMNSYAGVVDHPYFAVTDANGQYAIRNLPAGDYIIEAWHERYGTQEISVSVVEDDTQNVSFSFGAE